MLLCCHEIKRILESTEAGIPLLVVSDISFYFQRKRKIILRHPVFLRNTGLGWGSSF